jgi:NADH dehydrogenase
MYIYRFTSKRSKFDIKLLNEFVKLPSDDNSHILKIAIISAGALGVELAAEL